MRRFFAHLLCIVVSLLYAHSFAAGLLGIPAEEATGVGVIIKEISTGRILLEQDATRAMTPASTLKLYTAASAMCLLSENFRFETKVYLTGQSAGNGSWSGDIVVKASGDPTLESQYFSSNSGFIQKIIDSLSDRGIQSIQGEIIQVRVNPRRQYPEGPVTTWNINDVPTTYGCGAFDFNWCDNTFSLYPATGKTTSPVPELRYQVWDNPWTSSGTMRGIYSDSLIISGKQYSTNANARVTTSMPYPFNVFRSRLKTRLKDAGIAISGKPNSPNPDIENAIMLVNHKSPQLDEILKSMMLRSDNTFAEAILRKLGSQYGDIYNAIEAESKLWQSRDLKPQHNRILDGSGLSRANAVSPRFLAQILEWMAKSKYADRYISLFPVSGVSGTMRNFMSDTPLKGRLAFKSGSVNAVKCYAGYVTDNAGKPTHVVVIMVNNFFCSSDQLKNGLKKLLLEYIK